MPFITNNPAYTLIGLAERFITYFNNMPANVSFEYIDYDGVVKIKTVENMNQIKELLNTTAVDNATVTNVLTGVMLKNENIKFGTVAPSSSDFVNGDTLYIDISTATLYTKASDGTIVNSMKSTELDNILLNYFKKDRDIIIGDGEPDATIYPKLYIDRLNKRLYIKNASGALSLVVGSGITEAPVLVTDTTTITESGTYTVTITNYVPTQTYDVFITYGTATLDTNTGIITVSIPPVTENTTITLSATATAAGKAPSDYSTINFNVLDVLPTPILSANTDNIIEGNMYTINIVNYNPLVTYHVTTTLGAVQIDTTNGNINILVDNITDTQVVTVDVYGSATGKADSGVASMTFTAIDVLDTPILNSSVSSISEGTSFDVTITNYDSTQSYTISTTIGSAVLDTNTGVITVTVGDVALDSTATLTVVASKAGHEASAVASMVFTVLNTVASPVLSGNNSIIEGGVLSVTIDNYDSGLNYTISTNLGNAILNTVSGVIDITAPYVNVDSTGLLSVTVGDNGTIATATATFSYLVINATDTPILSGSTSVTEGGVLSVTIDNYDSNAIYTITSSVGNAVLDTTNGVINIAIPLVDADVNGLLEVTAIANGLPSSEKVSYSFTVVNVADTIDDAIINTNFSANSLDISDFQVV